MYFQGKQNKRISSQPIIGVKIVNLLEKHSISNLSERFFHITTSNAKNNKLENYKREGKFMNKIMRRDTPKKKRYNSQPPKSELSTLTEQRFVNPHVTRRVIVLNKIFMQHISDLMATGDISEDLLGRGIEISRVQLTNDFQIAQVFWFSSNIQALDETSEILNKIAYKLRHELTQLRVIGVVPLVQFVKDSQLMRAADLDKIFQTADYGDDYQPTIIAVPKPQLTLCTQLPNKVRDEIRKIKNIENEIDEIVDDSNDENNDEIYNVDLPPMRHDVLGFDHWKIMSTIKQSLNRSKEEFENRLDINYSTPETTEFKFNEKSFSTLRTREEDQAFIAFLTKRQANERRMSKQQSEIFPDLSDFQDQSEQNEFEDNNEIDYDDFDDIEPNQLQ